MNFFLFCLSKFSFRRFLCIFFFCCCHVLLCFTECVHSIISLHLLNIIKISTLNFISEKLFMGLCLQDCSLWPMAWWEFVLLYIASCVVSMCFFPKSPWVFLTALKVSGKFMWVRLFFPRSVAISRG